MELLNEAVEFATAITYAFPPPPASAADVNERAERAFRMSWSASPGNLIHDTKQLGQMEVDRDHLEYGVGQYLQSDFKDARIDRFLMRALADMELSAFLATQIGSWLLPMKSPLEIASQSVGLEWIKGRLLGLVITVALCVATVALKAYFPGISDGLVLSLLALFTGGYIVLTGFTLIALLITGPRIKKGRSDTMRTIRTAMHFYGEFHRTGVTSLQHYRMRMDEARQQGIVWPQPLWALIDDMEHRGIRFF